MFEIIRFIAVAVVATVIAGAGSVAWPKFTSSPRPPLVEKVYEYAKDTPVGQKTRDVLGVTATGDVAPIDLKSEATSLVNGATTVVEKKVQTIIATQAVLQLMHQINSLDAAQQEEIRSIVCSSDSGTLR
jgi:hypothetical protein